MKTITIAVMTTFCVLAQPCVARDYDFNGPRLGVEASYEDYGSAVNGDNLAVTAGWDLPIGDKLVLGVEARYTLHGVKGSEATRTSNGLVQTTDVAIKDNWGLGVRIGYAVGKDILLFTTGGYEKLNIDATRTVRADVCVPPNGCLVSRNDFSFNDDMWTVGAGAEWAMTENLRLRGQYVYGDSDSYDRNRFAISVAVQF